MTPEQIEMVEQAIEISKTAITQARKALKLSGEEQHELLKASHSNLTDAGALVWRSRTRPDPR